MLAVGRDMARDYGTFARAVVGLDARAVIVASERNLTDVTVPGNVELRLNVSYPELRELYAGAACVVLPTRREGYHYGADCSGQTVLLDAMAMGRPVVASERSTLSDYVRDPETRADRSRRRTRPNCGLRSSGCSATASWPRALAPPPVIASSAS